MCRQVTQEVTELLEGISMEQFMLTIDMISADQSSEKSQILMAAKQGKLTDENSSGITEAPKLDKAKALRAFEKSKDLTIEAMKRSTQLTPQTTQGGDEKTMVVDMWVDQAKVEDELFICEGVTNDELEEAMMYYMGQQDAEVHAAMGEYMRQMQAVMVSQQVNPDRLLPGM